MSFFFHVAENRGMNHAKTGVITYDVTGQQGT
jgi:hypothetical protein